MERPRRAFAVRTRALVAGGAVLAAMTLSVASGTPKDLPAIAFGWPLLAHVERSALLLVVAGSAVLVVWRATGGDYPVQFGNFRIEWERAIHEAGEAHERRLRKLEVLAGLRRKSRLVSEDGDA